MSESFRPTPAEFEAIVRFRAETRIQMLLRRIDETGEDNRTRELVIQEATDRLAELAEEIGEEVVGRIVAEVEAEVEHELTDHDNEQHRAAGEEIVRLLRATNTKPVGGIARG
jgi:AcrR family transcriptional regulator